MDLGTDSPLGGGVSHAEGFIGTVLTQELLES